jgi:hypothetical protein
MDPDSRHHLYLPLRWALLAATALWVLIAISTSAMPGLAYDEGPVPTDAYLARQLVAAAIGALAVGLPFRWSDAQPLFAVRMLAITGLSSWVIIDVCIRGIRVGGVRAIPVTAMVALYFAVAAWCAVESRRANIGMRHGGVPQTGA